MLDFLPNVWSEECNLKRVKIHAQLLLRLGLTRDALAIFLQRQLWQEAVEFYVEITRSSTDMLEVMDLFPSEQNFDLDKSGQKFHHSLKEHHKISNIPKFRCEMF